MMRFVETLWFLFFLLGLLMLGSLGTWDQTMPFWYGAAGVCIAGVGSLLSRQKPADRPAGKVAAGTLILFYAYIAWRALNSDVEWLARQDLVFATAGFVAWLLITFRFTAPRQRGAILAVFGILIVANVITGLHQYYQDKGFMVFQSLGFGRVEEKSASGFFSNSNHMAGFLNLALFPLLGVAVLGRGVSPFLRALGGLLFIAGGIGMGYSTSRGGIAGFLCALPLFIGIVLVILKSASSRQRGSGIRVKRWFFGLSGGFLLLIVVIFFFLRTRYGGANFLSNLAGLSDRGPLWDAALEQWQLNPVLGTGARSFEYMERAFRTLDTNWLYRAGEVDAIYAHSDVLQCLGDYGIIGFLLAVGALIAAGFHALRAIASSQAGGLKDTPAGFSAGLAVGSLCSMAALAVQSLADFNLHIGVNVVMASILMGFLATPGFQAQKAAPAKTGPASAPASPEKPGKFAFSPGLLCLSAITAGLSLIFLIRSRNLAEADFFWAKGRQELISASSVPEWLAASGHLQTTVRLDPVNANAWHYLGLLNTQLAKEMPAQFADSFDHKALDQLDRSLQLYPQNPYAAGLAGSLADYLGETGRGDTYFATALRWGLNIKTINNQYGDHLAAYKKDYAKAIGFYSIAFRMAPPEEKPNIQRKIDKCIAKLKEEGKPAPPDAFIKPGDLATPP